MQAKRGEIIIDNRDAYSRYRKRLLNFQKMDRFLRIDRDAALRGTRIISNGSRASPRNQEPVGRY